MTFIFNTDKITASVKNYYEGKYMTYRERYYRLFGVFLTGIDHLTDTVRKAEERFICIEHPTDEDYNGLYTYLLDELDRAVNSFDKARVTI